MTTERNRLRRKLAVPGYLTIGLLSVASCSPTPSGPSAPSHASDLEAETPIEKIHDDARGAVIHVVGAHIDEITVTEPETTGIRSIRFGE